MQKKSKFNWWVLCAVVLIGVPIGFAGTGFIKSMMQKESEQTGDTDTIPVKNPEPPVPTTTDIEIVKLSLSDVESILKSNREDSLIAETCKVFVVGDDNPQSYNDFRQRVGQDKYDSVNLDSLEYEGNKVVVIYARVTKKKVILPSPPTPNPPTPNPPTPNPPTPNPPTPNPPTPQPIEKLTKDEAQTIIEKGKADKRIAKECQISVNGEPDIPYSRFGAVVKQKAYREIAITGLQYDDDNRINQIEVTASLPPKPEPLQVNEVQDIVNSKRTHERIAKGCNIVINDGETTTTYDKYRSGIWKQYMDATVTNVQHDGDNKVIRIDMKANRIINRLTKAEVQKKVAGGQSDERIAEACTVKIQGNGETALSKFLENVKKNIYTNVKVSDVGYAADNKVNQITVSCNKELTPEERAELIRQKEDEIKKQIGPSVARGESNVQLSGTEVIVNGKTKKDYQDFSFGVRANTYSNVRVTGVELNQNGSVKSISVSADVTNANDED